jgi:hypothetical protein
MTQVKDKDLPRSKKQHPTFESWLLPAPHDSEEYDTDLEADMLKSELFIIRT